MRKLLSVAMTLLVVCAFGGAGDVVSSASAEMTLVDTTVATNDIIMAQYDLPLPVEYSATCWNETWPSEKTAVVTHNDASVYEATGEGVFAWMPPEAGLHFLRHTVDGITIVKKVNVVAPDVVIERIGYDACKMLATDGASPIHYTLDGSEPTLDSPLYTEPFQIGTTNLTLVRARTFGEGYAKGAVAFAMFERGGSLVSESSTSTQIDTRAGKGTLPVDGVIDVAWSGLWSGDADSNAVVTADGEEISSGRGEGSVLYYPATVGTHILTHQAIESSSPVGETLTATIDVLPVLSRGLVVDGQALIAEGTTEIADGAFANCADVTSVTIPNSVTNVAATAFAGCSNIVDATLKGVRWLRREPLPVADAAFHVDASDRATMDIVCENGKEYVTCWRDASGGQRYASAGTARPFLGTFNGNNIVDFGGFWCDGRGGEGAWMRWSEFDNSIREVFLVYCDNPNVSAAGGHRPFLLSCDADGSYDFHRDSQQLFHYNHSSSYIRNGLIQVDGQNVRYDYSLPDGYHIIRVRTTGSVRANTFAKDRDCRYGGQRLAEVIVYDFTLDDESAEKTYDYLKKKWFSRAAGMVDLFPDSYSTVRRLSIRPDEAFSNDAFVEGCASLVSVTLPYLLARSVSEQNRLTLESAVLTDVPQKIDDRLFADCAALKSFEVPDGTEEIGAGAFSGCAALASIIIPESVKRIGTDAFDGCTSLTSVEFPSGMEDFGLDLIPKEMRTELGLDYDKDGFMIWNGWLLDYEDREAEDVIVPEGVIGIGHYALSDMEMERLVLPSTLKYIASQAISCQWGLEELDIPDSVEYIGKGAFEGCSYVDTFTFGEGLKEIDDRAFAGCKSLAPSVRFSLGLEKIGSEAFADCERLMSLSLPVTVTNVAANAFTGCKNLTGVMTPTATAPLSAWFAPIYTQIKDVTVSPGEVEICDNMFKGCTALVSAAIPEGITNIGAGAFLDCARLPSVLLPSTLVSIGDEAFRNCDALTAVGLPNAVTRVGTRAFYDCGALKNVSLSRALEALPDQVFDSCGQLQSIVVPASVTNFGAKVFGGAMQSVYCLGDAPSYDENVYASTPSALTTHVNYGTLGWDGIAHSRNLPPRWPVWNANSRAIGTWSPVRYDVTFDAGDGVFTKPVAAQTYVCEQVVGTAYALPPYNPVRTGYAFDGWWDSATGGARISPSTGVTLQKSHTLYAHWKEGRQITVRFNANGGTVEPNELAYAADVPYGELPLPTREHFVFDGWYTAPQGGTLVRVSMEAPKADRELFAHWAPAVYQIRFHANNGSGDWVGQGFTYGQSVTFRRNPFGCEGCTFAGWSLEPGGAAVYGDGHTIASLSAIGNGVIDLYAVWTGNTYAVRFDSNGGVGQMANQTFVVGVGQPLLPCGFTRGGYVFLGWALSPSTQIRFGEGEVVKDLATQQGKTVDLYAVWGIAGQKTTLTFDAGDGSVGEPTRELEPGSRFGALPVPIWSGHAFGGWRDVHGDLVTEDSIVPPGEVRLTADWGVSVRISLPFCHGWRYLWMPAGRRFGYLPPLPREQAPRPGWCFCGWAFDIAGEQLVDPEDLVPEVDTELYAVWIPEDDVAGIDLPEAEYDDAGLIIWEGWLIGCENRDVSALAIPEGVVGIGQGALAHMYNLQTVLFPSTLREVGTGAFEYDTYLDNVDLPDSVETIGTNAFASCTWLQSLTLGTGVTRVAQGAFKGCAQLAKAEFRDGLKYVDEEAFADCWRMLSVAFPLSVTNVDSTAFTGCSSLVGATVPTHVAPLTEWFRPVYAQIRNVTVPAGETEVCSNMFKGCSALASVVLPEGVTNLADGAFWDCTGLPDIILPSSLQAIGADAFRNCDTLKAIGLPEAVTRLGARAFYDCYRLADVSLSACLTELPEQVFDSCSYLNSIVVPAAVANLGAQVFGGAMRSVYFVGNAPQYDDDAYAATSGSIITYVKDGSKGWESRSKPKSRFLPERWPADDNAYSGVLTTWEPIQYDVSFDAGEGAFYPVATNVYACQQTRGTAYSLPPFEPLLAGRKFAGWWTEREAGTQVTPSTGVKLTQEHTLYAHWTGGQAITVRFNACGGVVETEELQYTAEVPYGHFPVPTREHHVFVGWFTASSGGTRIKESAEVPLADVELFAQWTPTPYRIRFNANNGTGARIEQSFVYGQTVRLRGNTFYCSGCVFAGWSLTPGGAAVYGDRSTIPGLAADGVIDLYAVWSGAVYAVRFDSHGGTGTMANQTFVLGVSQPLAPCAFTRSGYVFAGWARSADGEVAYGDQTDVVDLTNVRNTTVVLYAVWERDPALEWTTEEYLNCTNLTFALGGDSPYWYGQKTARDKKKGMMLSGAIGDSQTNWIETVVSGPGTVSFWWKASGEYEVSKKGVVTMYDYAEFTIDGVSVAEIGADSSWTAVTQTVEQVGTHTLRWMYHKDESGSDGEDCAWISEVVWLPTGAPAEPIPDLGDNPTEKQIVDALADLTDKKIVVNITDGETYNDFRCWAEKVKDGSGNAAGSQAVKESPNAWVSFALGQDSLLGEAPTDEDLEIEAFEPAATDGKFDFTVSVKDIDVGSTAAAENLKKVFGLEGGASLKGLSPDNVDITFGTPENGKVKFTAGPNAANADATTFFMKVKLAP